MPIREVSIRYEFPTCAADRQAFIERHKKARRRWISTAIVDGRQRMKFAKFEKFIVSEAFSICWNDRKPAKAKPQNYLGQDSKGRAEWDR